MVEARRRGPWERNQGSKTPLRVLIVEDSADDALLIVRELVRGGYETYFERVDTPEAMREALDEGRWDVIISDHAMPRFSAPEALGILQEKALDLPFIIVSSEIGEDAAVAMMRAGAHDYVAKGNLTRLCPAVARELREAAERRERSRSEAALKQSEELYRSVVEQSSECIFLVDVRSKRILEANSAFRELLGYAPEELRKMTIYDFVAHDRASVDENIHLITKEGRHNIGERRYRRKDGTFVDVEVRANALLLDGREVMCCVSRDVTKRKLAEERRDAQYALSRILAESVSLEEAAPKLLEAIGTGLGWELGTLWMADQSARVLRCKEVWHTPSVMVAEFEAVSRKMSFTPGHGLLGRVWESGKSLWVSDVLEDANFLRLESAAKESLHGAFAFPIQDKGRVLGVIEFFSYSVLPPDRDLLQTVATMGNQIGQFIERKRGEEALRESEERYRVVAETASDAIVMIDEDSKILFVNSATEKIFGYASEEMVGNQLTILMPERLREVHKASLKRYVDTGRRHLAWEAVRLPGLHKSGQEIPLEISFGEFIKEGRHFITGFVRDITERKHAEEARARLAAIVESSDDAIIGKTLDGIITNWNSGAQKIYGYSAEEVIGKPINILVPSDRPNEISQILDSIRRGEAIDHYETKRIAKDGRRLDVSLTISPIRDSAGNIVGASTIARDITERKQAEEALRVSEDRLRLAVESTGLGTWDYDPITGDLKWDERCKAMFGLPPEAEVNYEVFLEGLHPEDRKRVDGVVQCALDPKSSGEFDIEYRTVGLRDRIERWVAARGQAFFDETGRAVRFIGTILEITERKRAEEVIKSRARQQAVIADLGIRALMNNDLSAVMDEAVTLVAHALRVEYCKVLELLPGEEELLLRAGVGWKEGFVGNATVRADLDSQVGYTLASHTPVVVEDLRTEKRFIGAPLLHEHGVVSGLNVIIHGPEGPFGVLGAHTKEKRTFTEDDVNFLQAVANVVSAAVERKRAEERLSEIKESERRRIAADLHDEVLQDMVHGLQEIQIAQLTSQRDGQDNAPDLKESLETASEALQRSVEGLRVAIFELHLEEILERSFVSSVEALVELNRRMSRKRFEVHMTVADGFPEAIPTQAGRSLLRILQEALSNARRHSGAKHIWVTLRTEGDDVYAEVADNGQGFDTESARGGVGTSAIRQRALDLGGALEIQSEPGAGTVVRFRGPAEHLFGG